MLSFSITRLVLLAILAKRSLGQGSDLSMDPTESTASGFSWLTHTPGASLSSGQSLFASWRSGADYPVTNPSFALCTQSDECGEASWPKVINNGDGSSSATLSLPPVQGGMSGLYLKMKSDDQNLYHSPSFDLGIDAVMPGVSDMGDSAATGPVPGVGSSSGTKTNSNPYYWGTATPTKGASPTGSNLSGGGGSQSLISIPTYDPDNYPDPTDPNKYLPPVRTASYQTTPTPHPTQIPFAYTTPIVKNLNTVISTPQSSLNATVLPISAASDTTSMKQASRPSIAAIAVPLSACGVILLAALVFCARRRGFRAPAAKGEGGRGDEERGWEKVVREKAAVAAAAGVQGNGVTVVQRKEEENPYRYAGTVGPEGGVYRDGCKVSGHRCIGADIPLYDRHQGLETEVRSRSGTGDRCLTPVRGRDSRDYRGERFASLPGVDYSRRFCGGESRSYSGTGHGGKRHYENYRDRRGDVGYYTTSRRSSSGLGGWHDNRDEWDIRPKSHAYSLYRDAGPSRECVERGCVNCVRQGSSDSNGSRSSIYNPHPPTPTSMTRFPHSGENRNRPLPTPLGPPLIRTPSMYTTDSNTGWKDNQAKKAGILERGWSEGSVVSHSRWEDRASGRRGRDVEVGREGHGAAKEGLEEVYESLRRAIGTTR